MKKVFLLIAIILLPILLVGYKPSNERKLLHDIINIPFKYSPKKIELLLSKFDSKNFNMIQYTEGQITTKIKKDVGESYFYNIKQDLFDEDFTITPSRNGATLKLNQIAEYKANHFFDYNKWNPLITKVRFTFIFNKLYDKEFIAIFSDVNQALVVLRTLKSKFKKPDIEQSEIHYRGYNRFVWSSNQNYRVEYLFYPVKNQFSQMIGYESIIKMTHTKLNIQAKSHIRKLKSKLKNLLLNY